MKRNYLLIATCFVLAFSCKSEKKSEVSDEEVVRQENLNEFEQDSTQIDSIQKQKVLKFDALVHDFGAVKKGDKVKTYFKFTNVGEKPITINYVQTSCGCTAPQYPKEPILPNASDSILLEYNSAGNEGIVEKKATVYTNTDATEILTIKGKVN
ncbi:MAG: DUF1573 domain-containing protein [Flavobacteriales bacterium]|nr:DUF1573 domain-containing protein [Flavobacteriales bacterium]